MLMKEGDLEVMSWRRWREEGRRAGREEEEEEEEAGAVSHAAPGGAAPNYFGKKKEVMSWPLWQVFYLTATEIQLKGKTKQNN